MLNAVLKSVDEFFGKDAWEDSVFLKILENKHPSLYQRTIGVLRKTCEWNGDDNNYTEEELFEIFTTDEIIEIFEDLYFENEDEKDDIIVKYTVHDNNLVGYKLLECV